MWVNYEVFVDWYACESIMPPWTINFLKSGYSSNIPKLNENLLLN